MNLQKIAAIAVLGFVAVAPLAASAGEVGTTTSTSSTTITGKYSATSSQNDYYNGTVVAVQVSGQGVVGFNKSGGGVGLGYIQGDLSVSLTQESISGNSHQNTSIYNACYGQIVNTTSSGAYSSPF